MEFQRRAQATGRDGNHCEVRTIDEAAKSYGLVAQTARVAGEAAGEKLVAEPRADRDALKTGA